MENFRSQSLVCGCCGQQFKTREGYVDQDQDQGYGICKRCQDDEVKRNAKRYEETFKMIYEGSKQSTREKIDKQIEEVGDEYKVILVNIALDKGWIKWYV